MKSRRILPYVVFSLLLISVMIPGISYATDDQPVAINFQLKAIATNDHAVLLWENVDGEYQSNDANYFKYTDNYWVFSKGDTLTLTMSDGVVPKTVNYTYDEEVSENGGSTWYFINDNNPLDKINTGEISCSSNQSSNNQWTTNNNNCKYALTYKGVSCDIPAKIIPVPVKSFSFTRAKGNDIIELIENLDGGECYETSNGVTAEWFQYEEPGIEAGDKITLTMSDDSMKEYTYRSFVEDGDEGLAFVDANNNKLWDLPNAGAAWFEWTSDQSYNNEWKVNETHKFIPTLGINSPGSTFTSRHIDINGTPEQEVKIVPNPVQSVSFSGQPVILTENVDGFWTWKCDGEENRIPGTEYFQYEISGLHEGDTLTITKTNGAAEVLTYRYMQTEEGYRGVFVDANGNQRYIYPVVGTPSYGQSYENQWSVGSFTYPETYMGKTFEIPVTIVRQSSESPSINPTPTTVEIPISSGDGENAVPVTATISEGTATIGEISKDTLDKVEADKPLTLDLSGRSGESKETTAVSLTSDTLKNIADSPVSLLEVKLDNASATIDKETLQAVSEQAIGSDVRFSVATGDNASATMTDAQKEAVREMTGDNTKMQIIDAAFTSGGKTISDFKGGTVTISVLFDTLKSIRAWFLADNGDKTRIKATQQGKNAILELPHFSHYVIEEYDPASNTLNVKAKTAVLKYSKVKKVKQTLTVNKLMTIRDAVGNVTYQKTSGKNNFKVDAKTGKLTVKKGTKKGTYKVGIKVIADGNDDYLAGEQTVKVTLKVK